MQQPNFLNLDQLTINLAGIILIHWAPLPNEPEAVRVYMDDTSYLLTGNEAMLFRKLVKKSGGDAPKMSQEETEENLQVQLDWRSLLDPREAAKVAHAESYARNFAGAGVAGHTDFLLLAKLVHKLDSYEVLLGKVTEG